MTWTNLSDHLVVCTKGHHDTMDLIHSGEFPKIRGETLVEAPELFLQLVEKETNWITCPGMSSR